MGIVGKEISASLCNDIMMRVDDVEGELLCTTNAVLLGAMKSKGSTRISFMNE